MSKAPNSPLVSSERVTLVCFHLNLYSFELDWAVIEAALMAQRWCRRKHYQGGHGREAEGFLHRQLPQDVHNIQVPSSHCIAFKSLDVFPVLQGHTDLQDTKTPRLHQAGAR